MHPQQATGRNKEELHQRNPKFLTRRSHGKRHETVNDKAAHRRRNDTFSRFSSNCPVVDLGDELEQRSGEVLPGGLAKGRDVLGGVGVRRRRHPIGDGLEAEAAAAEGGIGVEGSAFEEALVVVFGVDEGDVEALVVEELGEFEHCLDVALYWERKA